MTIKPYITEKTLFLAKQDVFTFIVSKNANKIELAKALEKLHKVAVQNVTIASIKPTQKRFRQTKGQTKILKKAMVRLKKGQKIPGFEVIEQSKQDKKDKT